MDVKDYLIDQNGVDWAGILSDWVPPLPSSFTVWLVNRFCDIFSVFEDGSVHMLDLGTGVLTRLADNRDDFAYKIDAGDNANNWLMIPLVDQCTAAGMLLRSGQCFGYKIPPILGGQYTVENITPTDIAVHCSFMADICRQTKDLPNGTKVKVVLKK